MEKTAVFLYYSKSFTHYLWAEQSVCSYTHTHMLLFFLIVVAVVVHCLFSVHWQQKLVSGQVGEWKVNHPFFQQLWASFISNRFRSSDKTLPLYMFDTKTDRWHRLFHIEAFCLVSPALTGFPTRKICQSILPCLGFWGLFLQRDQMALASEEEGKHECSVSFHCECKWKFCFYEGEYARLPMFVLDECAFSLFPPWHQCTTMRPYPDYELHNTLESSSLSDLKKSLYVCNVKHPCCGQLTEGSLI